VLEEDESADANKMDADESSLWNGKSRLAENRWKYQRQRYSRI